MLRWVFIALCVAACEPANVGVELPEVAGMKSLLVAPHAASGTEYSRVFAIDPEGRGEDLSALRPIEEGAARIDVLVSPCTLAELGLRPGVYARERSGRSIALSRCVLSLDVSAAEEGWSPVAMLPAMLQTFLIADAAVTCPAAELAAECP